MMTEQSVAGQIAAREPAGAGPRFLAAVLDGLLLTIGSSAILFSWTALAHPMEPGFPTYLTALLWAILALYVIGTSVLGATIGMAPLGLRITMADGSEPSRLRLLGRGVLLFAVVAVGWQLTSGFGPLVLISVYALFMLVNPRHQLPHDLLFGTVVAARALPKASQRVLDQVGAQYGDLPSPEAKVLLGDLEHLRRRARGALHLASVPIFVLALIAFGAATVDWNNALDAFEAGSIYWGLAGLFGLAMTAWWFGRQQQRRGAATAWRSTLVIAVAVALGSSLTLFLPVGPLLVGAGFLAVAVIQRSLPLGIAAAAFTAVATLESPWLVISNAITSNSLEPDEFELLVNHGSGLVFACLGLLLVAAAALTARRERIGA